MWEKWRKNEDRGKGRTGCERNGGKRKMEVKKSSVEEMEEKLRWRKKEDRLWKKRRKNEEDGGKRRD